MDKLFEKWYLKEETNIIQKFTEYLSIDSSSPKEADAYNYLYEYLTSVDFDVTKEYLNANLEEHELYTYHKDSKIDRSRFNIKAKDKNYNGNLLKILFNSHIDVVPSSHEFENAFNPIIKDGYLYGRGACDTKNNLIMLIEAIRFVKENKLPLKKAIEIDLVIEEEITGNGTLSAVMNNEFPPDFVIVLEPTNLNVFRGHRGVITTCIEVNGKPVHMGSDLTGESAIENAIKIIEILKLLEAKLLKIAKENAGFNCWDKPVQVNVGKIIGGEWAGSVPEKCALIVNVGFTNEFSIKSIQHEIESFIRESCGNMDIEVSFPELKNEAFLIEENNVYLKDFLKIVSGSSSIQSVETYGWRVSCDAHYYNSLLQKPTIIFGCGDLTDAHSSHERINLEEFKRGIQILAKYLTE